MSILSLEGDTLSGKSALLYTAPPPIVCFAFDAGATRALYGSRWKLYEGLDIEIVQYPPQMLDLSMWDKMWVRNGGKAITIFLLPEPVQTDVKPHGVLKIWNDFTILCNRALLNPAITTVGIDTATLARRIASDAYLETMPNRESLIEVEWGKPGDMIRSVFTTAQNQVEAGMNAGGPNQKHFIITNHLRPQRQDYIDGKGVKQSMIKTDSRGQALLELEGLGNTYRFMDIALRMENQTIPHPIISGETMTIIRAQYMKNGYDLSLKGQWINNPTWDSLFTQINKNLHPDRQIQLRGNVTNGTT